MLKAHEQVLPSQGSLTVVGKLTKSLTLFLRGKPTGSTTLRCLNTVCLLTGSLRKFGTLIRGCCKARFLPMLPIRFRRTIVIVSRGRPSC